ncbi:MAG: hypothetical protein K6C97_10530 [Treponema sp.]|nr:hypothetical protein [Treponema sp.]
MKMLMKLNKYICSTLLLMSGSLLFAQNIELPDVTTVITGDTVTVGADALPDFEDVLLLSEGSGDVVPVLPDVESPSSSELNNKNAGQSEKSIFAEGQIGGGYPTLFKGDFSVFRLSGLSPFKLYFGHDSSVAYGSHALTDGFSDRSTNLTIEKSFKKNQFKWGFDGAYQSLSNGLQNHMSGITNLNQDNYSGAAFVECDLSKGFLLGLKADLNFYNRYADVASGSFPTASVITTSPELFFKWQGYGFEIGIDGSYSFEDDINNVAYTQSLHRGLFGTSLSWSNDYVKVYGNVHGLVGNQINDNTILAPFTVGIDSSFPVYFSNRRVSISVKGGLDSFMKNVSELERTYKFTSLTLAPTETTDWFANFQLALPLKESFTGNLSVEYRKTAFGNGYWQPLYSSTGSGLYAYGMKEMQQLNTDISLTYHYKIFSISGGWKSYWMDLPVLEDAYKIYMDLNFQSQDSKWGFDLNGSIALGEADYNPIINFEAFVRLTSAVRAVVSIEDMVKLVKAEPRVYAGQYISRGGTATLMLKFFF